MNLNKQDWKEFKLEKLFTIRRGDRIVKDEDYFAIPPAPDYKYRVITASATNNSVDGVYNQTNCLGNCLISCGEANGMFTTWQDEPCWALDTVRIYTPIGFTLSRNQGLYLACCLTFNMYRFSYGRKAKPDNMYSLDINLPIQHHLDGTPVIDPKKEFSKDGYIPDWQFMENYIKSLHYKPLTTSRAHAPKKELNISKWKDFVVGDIFNIQYGINMELNACEPCNIYDQEAVAFVARTAENNGVSAFVKKEQGMLPQAAGTITCAGGGSVLSTFVQAHDFYSGRDLYLLNTKENLSVKTKIFLTTVLLKNQYRYSYGRQANKTLPTLLLKLPIQHHSDGTPVIDPEKKYSKEGYIPDWQFMEDYINSLPYSDKIK